VAVAQVRPSKWTYFFFGGLALTLVGRFVWSRREQVQFVHDAPLAHTTRRLLRCMVGRDVQRMLGDRSTARATEGTPGWSDRIEDRLRRIASAHANDEWPSRCVPIAERLETRLGMELHAQRAQRAALDVRGYLTAGSARRIEFIRVVESGDLANALATLAYEVSGLTSAAEEGWSSPLGNASTDLYPVDTVSFPHARAVAVGGESAALVMPDLLVYQSVADRRFHRVTFDASEVPTDRDVGRGAPVVVDQRGGTVLVSSNEGDSVFVPYGEPAPLVPLAEPVRRGAERVDGWSTYSTEESLAWIDVSNGFVHLRATPRSGEVQWRDVGTFGAQDRVFGAVLLPHEFDRVRVAMLERGANSLSLAIRTVALDGTGAPADGGEEISRPGGEWLTFDPHMRVCESETARHVLLHDAYGMRAIRFDATGAVATQDMRFERLGAIADRRFEWHCNETHALLFADFEQRNEAMVIFDYGEGAPHVVRAPTFGHNPHTTGAALTRDRLVVAVANDATVRAYDTPIGESLFAVSEDSIVTWTGGTLLAVADRGRGEGDARSLQVVTMIGRGDQVALLAAVREGARGYVGRLASRDDGRTFRGD
jgi:hypothetical protein